MDAFVQTVNFMQPKYSIKFVEQFLKNEKTDAKLTAAVYLFSHGDNGQMKRLLTDSLYPREHAVLITKGILPKGHVGEKSAAVLSAEILTMENTKKAFRKSGFDEKLKILKSKLHGLLKGNGHSED